MPDLYERVIRDGKPGLRFHPHAGQFKALQTIVHFLLVLCGFQSGKTVFGPIWLEREIQRTFRDGEENDYLACSADYDVLRLKMLPALLFHFVECRGWLYRASDRIIEGPRGERIILRSAGAPRGLESVTAKAAWCDEWGMDSVDISVWDALQRRLAVYEGRVLITTTPYNLGWLYTEVYKRAIGGDPNYGLVNFRSIDNPVFPRAEWDRLWALWPKWKSEMMLEGKMVRPAGLIYSDYDDSYAELEPVYDESGRLMRFEDHGGGHLVKPFSIPAHWLRRVGVDFGASLHNAQEWWAEEPGTGNYYWYRDVSQIDRTGPEQARDAKDYAEPVAVAYGGAPSEDDARLEWAKAGFPVSKPLIHDVEPGIDAMTGLFRTRRLFVFDTVTGVRSDLGTYSRELDDAGEPTMKIKDKEKWHRMDAGRAVASGVPQDRPPRPVIETYDPTSRTIESIKQQKRIFGMGGADTSKRREYAR